MREKQLGTGAEMSGCQWPLHSLRQLTCFAGALGGLLLLQPELLQHALCQICKPQQSLIAYRKIQHKDVPC